ncbi:hypothetical protein F183_A22760 [Bryobacterales bacterium F-183]|nr:hypothetical protein F183_A22760 [Bryobacterales bacterium F-183]
MESRLIFAFFALSALAVANEAEEAVRRFLAKVPKGPYAVVWRNLSTMPAAEAERIHRMVEPASIGEAGPEFRVTLSENPKSYLIVGQSVDGKVWMETWAKPVARVEKPPYRLSRNVVWEQPTPILDALVMSGGRVLVLEPMRVSGKDVKTVGLSLPRPMPRDPRGRIFDAGSEGIRILLPGVRCAGPLQKLSCTTAREPWIVAARNYFEGPRGRYYTMAELDGVVVQAETDGRTRVYAQGAGGDTVLRVIEGWGSEMTSIESGCGTHVLASLEADQLQAFRYAGGQMYPSTAALVLEGPVTAIWPSSEKGQATVIVQNRSTGNYEASRVSIDCSGN